MMRPTVLAAVVASSLLLCAPAGAATVTMKSTTVDSGKDPHPFTEVVVTGDGQDADEITVRAADGGGVEIADATALLTTGPDCQAVDAHRVACTGPITAVTVDGGDGSDRLTVDGALSASLRGGTGDDVLQGGPLVDWLDGGPGRDEVHGGDGYDEVALDAAGGLTGDVVDAGPGGGRLGVRTDVPGLTLDLAAGTLTGSGTADAVTGFADVTMGPAANTLLGDDGPNTLVGSGLVDGRGGADIISGGPGADRLIGGPGDDGIRVGPNDVVDAGAGDDNVTGDGGWPLSARQRATVACGAGNDLLKPFGATATPIDCEWTMLFNDVQVAPPARAERTLLVRVKIATALCGLVVWAESPTTHRRITPRVQTQLRPRRSVITVRLADSTSAKRIDVAVALTRSCPRHARWPAHHPSTATLLVARR